MQQVKSASRFRALRQAINRSHTLVIQTHDFPDHDAVATAFALQQLLSKFSHDATICYGGEMQSPSLQRTVHALNIDIRHIFNVTITAETQIIVVDGCRENHNFTLTPGNMIAIIDHHENSLPHSDQYLLSDIRLYGSCSTILAEYYLGMDIPPSPRVATALMMGIMMDTAHLTRGVQSVDFEAVQFLFPISDWDEGARLLRNSLTLGDLDLFRTALSNCVVRDFFCFIKIGYSVKPDVAGLLGDFFLTISEINFVVVLSTHSDGHHLSVRSEQRDAPANIILREVLRDIGKGGGHTYMAAGLIEIDKGKNISELYRDFVRALHIPLAENELVPL